MPEPEEIASTRLIEANSHRAEIDDLFSGHPEAFRNSENSPHPLFDNPTCLEDMQMPRNTLHVGAHLGRERNCCVRTVLQKFAHNTKAGWFPESGKDPQCC